jgi:hypothetical protein
MTEPAFEQEYLEYVDGRIQWHKRSADRTMLQFITVRLALVLISASLPALTVLPNRVWATVAAVLVAALAGLDTQFQWGEEWRHFRSTQLALERARRDFDMRAYAIAAGSAGPGAKSATENFTTFYKVVEELLQSETDRFFKFRITPWKKGSARSE